MSLLLIALGLILVITPSISQILTQSTKATKEVDYNAKVQQAKKLICNLNARGFSSWVFIERTGEIPYQKGDFKNPADYAEQIHAPSVEKANERSVVELYTWTKKGGLLVKWTDTVERREVIFLRGEILQVAVGTYTPIPMEGNFIPSSGDLLVNEAVDSLNVEDNPSCRQMFP